MQSECARIVLKVPSSVHAHTHLTLWSHPQQALGPRHTLAPLLPAPASLLTRQQGRHEASLERPQVLT